MHIPWKTLPIKLIVALLVLGLTGVPDVCAQAAQQSPAQPSPTPAQPAQTPTRPAQPQRPASLIPDPAQAPLTPVPANELPNAPSQQAQPPAPGTKGAPPAVAPQNAPQSQPLGAAAAEAPKTSGGPASKPAGTAIAPAKQRQVRSLLIKLGAIAGAGVALGTVYALSRGTSSVPPGATSATPRP